MALIRLTICTRNCLRKRLFANYDVGSMSSFIRCLNSPADANYFETHEKAAPRFTTSRKQSQVEMDDLKQLQSKIRALHGITESSENFEIRADSKVGRSAEEAEFDYFGDGKNALEKDIDEDVRAKESDFIDEARITEKPYDCVEVTYYGKIRKDHPFKKTEDESDRRNIRKHFNEERRQRELPSDVDYETFNSFSRKSPRQGEHWVRDNVKKESFRSKTSSANFFDEQYFDLPDNKANNKDLPREDARKPESFIEEQYFSSKRSEESSTFDGNFEKFVSSSMPRRSSLLKATELPPNPPEAEKKWSNNDTENVNFFDEKFFNKSDDDVSSKQRQQPTRIEKSRSNRSHENNPKELSKAESFSLKSCDEIKDFSQLPPFTFDLDDLEEEPVVEDDNTTRIENMTRKEMKSLRSKQTTANLEQPLTAYEAVLKMRLEKGIIPSHKDDDGKSRPKKASPGRWDGKRDSKGFRILESQTEDWQKFIDMDLVSMLCDSILFENEELLVINKPYGLPSQGGPGITKSVASLLEKMAARREKNTSTYYIVHRLDKETTGVMLLAKTEKTAKLLTQMFLKRQVVKVYWAITKSVPNPLEGIIDIPIGEETIGDKYRMNLAPEFTMDMRPLKNQVKLRHISNAVTHYKVLGSNDYSALVECRPESGLKHQIRCHLAFGLNTPILGDHKYSHISKIAPQKLSPQILRKLGIRQPKVRHLAMHLHAKSLVLPEFLPDGRNLIVSANIPPHFAQNMKWLKLHRN